MRTHGTDWDNATDVLAVSLELSAGKWKVALHDGRRESPAIHTVAQPQAAARLQAVLTLIVGPENQPEVARELEATVCWMAETPARVGGRYLLKHTTRRVRANLASIDGRVDIDTLDTELTRGPRHGHDNARATAREGQLSCGRTPATGRPTSRCTRSGWMGQGSRCGSWTACRSPPSRHFRTGRR